MKLAPFALLVLTSASAVAQLTEAERKGIEETLYIGNLGPEDMRFERKQFAQPGRLQLIDQALDDPLEGADRLMAFHGASKRSLDGSLNYALSQGFNQKPVALTLKPLATVDPRVPPSLQAPIAALVELLGQTSAKIRQASAKLSEDERRQLIESLPQFAVEQPLKFDFARRPQATPKQVRDLLARVDVKAIRAYGANLTTVLRNSIAGLRAAAAKANVTETLRFRIGGTMVELSGKGNDVHSSSDAALCIDLGGNDIYTGRYGAGVGYASILVDLSGDDRYDVGSLSVGGAVLGAGIAADLGGNDTYRGRSLTFGSGLAGVGVLWDAGGDDNYRSSALAQGFGQYGIGLLRDDAGRDFYELGYFGQGAARTEGIGWLTDLAGSDTYRAGSMFLDQPLFKDAYQSNAQGFGSGYREDTGGWSGGIGMLTDAEGDDVYNGGTYCQAASYWFSLGSLFDGAGNDTYTAHHYAQASAMHMTGAYLFDLGGSDAYTVRVGACHGIGHDYGLAFLLDRSGDDVYAARDSRPGIGNANGLGLFLDAGGEDRYAGPPGVGNASRGTGSLGVFADLSGPDQYRDGFGDGEATVSGTWAVAYDAPAPDATEPVAAEEKPVVQPGSAPAPLTAEMEEIYRKATLWGVGTAQAEVIRNVNRLIAIGKPALEWMLENKLRRADRLQLRAFTAVINALGDEGKTMLAPKVASENEDEARNALRLVIETRASVAGPQLVDALKRPALRKLTVRAAGAVRAKEVLPDLLALAAEKDESLVLEVLIALGEIADPASVATAQPFLASANLPIRKAAMNLVAKYPNMAIPAAQALLSASEERPKRIAIELLGRVGTPEALTLVGPFLTTGSPGTKVTAMLALQGRVPVEHRAALEALRRDPSAPVRAVAAKLDPGR